MAEDTKPVGSEPTGDGSTPAAGDAPVAPPAADGAPASGVPDTTLLSRVAGLDAKVTELQKQTQAAEAARAAAEAKLADYEAGKVNADEALRAQLAAKDAEIAAIQKEALLAQVKAQYPETFGVLGDAAAGLTADQLAASEARFAGVASPAAPLGANPARQQDAAPKKIEDMTIPELEAHMRAQGNDAAKAWLLGEGN